jgi:hypothetical protein
MRRNLWAPPERTLLSRQRTISTYADPDHLMGHATAEQMRQSADHFSYGGPAPVEIMTHRELQPPPRCEPPVERFVAELSSDQHPKRLGKLYTSFDDSSVSSLTEARAPGATSSTGSFEQLNTRRRDINSALSFGVRRSGEDEFDVALAQALRLRQEEEDARQPRLLGNEDEELDILQALRITSHKEEEMARIQLELAQAPWARRGRMPRDQTLIESPEPNAAFQHHRRPQEPSAYIATSSRTPINQQGQDTEPRLEKGQGTTKRTTMQSSATDTIVSLDEPEEWPIGFARRSHLHLYD